MKQQRLNKILQEMERQNIPQMLISSPASIFYLTGKWIEPGERMLTLYINTNGDKKLLINELFPVNAIEGVELIWYKDTDEPIGRLINIVDKTKVLGVDKFWPAHFLIKLMERNAAAGFVNGSPIIDRTRMIKDAEEIQLMKDSSRINDSVMEEVIKTLSEEYSEKKMVNILAEIYENKGADGFSFSPIVAYGANAADPHHDSDSSKVQKGNNVIFDIGGVRKHYCSDMTRTVFYKEVSDEHKAVYNLVREANLTAIDKVKPGVRFCDIDKAARDVIENAGYGKYFTHRTGHSIGIEVHDFGDVSSVNTEEVAPGMIFSIEPGIYLSGDIGVRIEDLVLVTETGVEVLNKFTKDLIIVK
ncbi:Xaa-Pro dipeptidase [Clostridium amylolyticum]|uniref:Xaa-Pro dipeptidase n=1 Tax=Clostridium amylolyticum TaxID=1121298 RepID=A0A1M6LKQ5_9CLOT|nr:Xaa-Pro peptidase family protein [Clostridium amylolyticum]SHJ71796.1 Xaa-Pro dipeptidase [Clostridium amylolyticum]